MNLRDLLASISVANLGRAATVNDTAAAEVALEAAYRCSQRLAVYGTLAPGGSNHAQLAPCIGTWQHAAVPGRRSMRDNPVFTYDPNAPLVAVQLFVSGDLPLHWPKLDAFEGADYHRILVPVFDGKKLLTVANLYEAVAPV